MGLGSRNRRSRIPTGLKPRAATNFSTGHVTRAGIVRANVSTILRYNSPCSTPLSKRCFWMTCCTKYCAAEAQFNRKRAERDLRRYRRRGADATTRLLLTELRRWPIEGASVLDVGGGIGSSDWSWQTVAWAARRWWKRRLPISRWHAAKWSRATDRVLHNSSSAISQRWRPRLRTRCGHAGSRCLLLSRCRNSPPRRGPASAKIGRVHLSARSLVRASVHQV